MLLERRGAVFIAAARGYLLSYTHTKKTALDYLPPPCSARIHTNALCGTDRIYIYIFTSSNFTATNCLRALACAVRSTGSGYYTNDDNAACSAWQYTYRRRRHHNRKTAAVATVAAASSTQSIENLTCGYFMMGKSKGDRARALWCGAICYACGGLEGWNVGEYLLW